MGEERRQPITNDKMKWEAKRGSLEGGKERITPIDQGKELSSARCRVNRVFWLQSHRPMRQIELREVKQRCFAGKGRQTP